MQEDNKRKHLFYCDTPFQIMMALSFKMSILSNEIVEIIVSSIISDSQRLFNNINNSLVFDRVHYCDDYDYAYNRNNRIQQNEDIINRKTIVESLIDLDDQYYAFYATDTLRTIDWIYDYLLIKNPDIKMFYYEEGPLAVLCDSGNHFKEKEVYGGYEKFSSECIARGHHINGNYDGAYVSVKSEMGKSYFNWYELPRVSSEKIDKYISTLNQFWKYEKPRNQEKRVIYIEESFYTDNRGNKDEEILKDIVSIVNREDLCIKLHPRTKINRFKNMGIEVYSNIGVPWELIALNHDCDNMIMICVASGSAIHPAHYWGLKQKSVCLVDCVEYRFDYLNQPYYKLFSDFCKKRNLAFLPQRKQDFLDYLSNEY